MNPRDSSFSSASICVRPLASPYTLLPRAHTYALVLALIVPLPEGWLFRAALAGFTTRTAIFIVDSFVLLAELQHHPHDPAPLDVLISLESLALASIVAVWLLMVSRRGARSSARNLIRLWAIFTAVGAIVSYVNLLKLSRVTTSGPCQNHNELKLIEDIFGKEVHYGAGIGDIGGKLGYLLRQVGVPCLVFASLAIIAAFTSRPTSSNNADKSILPVTSNRRRAGELVILSNGIGGSGSGTAKPGSFRKVIRILLLFASPAMLIVIVYSTEWYLYRKTSGIPSIEPVTSVGQWGVWAATGVVLVATMIAAVAKETGDSQANSFDKKPKRLEQDLVVEDVSNGAARTGTVVSLKV